MAWSMWDIGCCCNETAICSLWDDNFPTRQGSYNPWFDDFTTDTEADYVYQDFTGTNIDRVVTGGQLEIETLPAGSSPYVIDVRTWKHFHVPETVATLTVRGKIGVVARSPNVTQSSLSLQIGDFLQYPSFRASMVLTNTHGSSSAELVSSYIIQTFTSDSDTTGGLAISEDLEFEIIATNAGGHDYTAVMKAWESAVLLDTHTFATARTNSSILTAPDYGARRMMTGCGFFIMLRYFHSATSNEDPIFYLDDIEVDWTE